MPWARVSAARRLLFVGPVALHDQIAADEKFASGAARHSRAVSVHNLDLHMGVSSANRASSSNHFPPNSALTLVNPVTFPPGRAKFVDEPVGYFALIFF
jgi:hypothetical protein